MSEEGIEREGKAADETVERLDKTREAFDPRIKALLIELVNMASVKPDAERLYLSEVIMKFGKVAAMLRNSRLATAPEQVQVEAAIGELTLILSAMRKALDKTYGETKGNA